MSIFSRFFLFNLYFEPIQGLLDASSPEMQRALLSELVGAGPGLSVVLYHQLQGSLGANTVSSMAAGTGIIILLINLKTSMACIYNCQDIYDEDFCLIVSFSTVCISCGKAKILGPNLGPFS